MKANYHTHTYLCRHAGGTMREMVQTAQESGMKTLGFSCHAPYPFPDGYYSDFRMYPDDMEIYVNTVLELRKEFAGQTELLIGYEAEYYPALFDDFLKMINRYPCDYLILGQHSINNEYDNAVFVSHLTDDIRVIEKYAHQVCEAMRTGVFSYVAHPDIAAFSGERALYLDKMKEICRVAAETETPLEINMSGLHESRHYPSEDFFTLAAEHGCKAIIGCDAHLPHELNRRITYEKAVALAEKCSIKLIEELPLKRPLL